jgi:hypothetical protein
MVYTAGPFTHNVKGFTDGRYYGLPLEFASWEEGKQWQAEVDDIKKKKKLSYFWHH